MSLDWPARWRRLRLSVRPLHLWLAAVPLFLLLLAVLAAAAFPVSLAKSWIEQRASDRFGSRVTIGSISRTPWLSFSPMVTLHDVRIAQPGWAGSGDLLHAADMHARIHMLSALMGRGLAIDAADVDHFTLALVRLADRRANWKPQDKSSSAGAGRGFTALALSDGHFTLRDERRRLVLSGTIASDAAHGLRIESSGRFHDAPARLTLRGAPIAARSPRDLYPFTLSISSPLLQFTANGGMDGALNLDSMTFDARAQAPTLKYLDDIIEAGLFGTQPIDLHATVRHSDQDWFVDRMAGRIGRSLLTGKATLLKRDARSEIDADVHFSQLDFDDLADDKGKAAAAQSEAMTGPRIIPATRINIEKVGPTDGTIRFVADRLLFETPSAFQSLSGTIRLDGKLLTLDDIRAGLRQGEMTGRLVVDQRGGLPHPRLHMLFDINDGSLGALLGAPDIVDGSYRAHIDLRGTGDTIRAALANADGKAGLVVQQGSLSRLAAATLGQDLGKTIGAAIGGGDRKVALNCAAVAFSGTKGALSAAPLAVETELASSRGFGGVSLEDESISLQIVGAARDPSPLPLVDPIRITGTFAKPQVLIANSRSGRENAGALVGALVKSVGAALGLSEKGPHLAHASNTDCAALSRTALRN